MDRIDLIEAPVSEKQQDQLNISACFHEFEGIFKNRLVRHLANHTIRLELRAIHAI